MAIRHRTGRKKPWEVYWNNPFTRKRESLYTEAEEEAKKQDALKKYQLKFERDMFRPEEPCETQENATLETGYYLYLKDKMFSKKSLAWQLDAMKKPLEMLGNKPLGEITPQDLQSIKQAQTLQGVAPVTVRNRLSVLRTVLRWCHRNDFMETMPRFPELPPAAYKHVIPPTERELYALWQVSPEHIRRVIVFGSMFGVRVGPSEMFKIRWSDFDFDSMILRVRAAKKNILEPLREIPVRDSLRTLLLEWKQKDDEAGSIYAIHYHGKPILSVKKAWWMALKRAGVRTFTPYSLRHMFATNLLAAGVDPGTVAKLMGHTSTAMIFSHYQHVISEQKRRAIEALPELPGTVAHVAETMWQKKKALTN